MLGSSQEHHHKSTGTSLSCTRGVARNATAGAAWWRLHSAQPTQRTPTERQSEVLRTPWQTWHQHWLSVEEAPTLSPSVSESSQSRGFGVTRRRKAGLGGAGAGHSHPRRRVRWPPWRQPWERPRPRDERWCVPALPCSAVVTPTIKRSDQPTTNKPTNQQTNQPTNRSSPSQ